MEEDLALAGIDSMVEARIVGARSVEVGSIVEAGSTGVKSIVVSSARAGPKMAEGLVASSFKGEATVRALACPPLGSSSMFRKSSFSFG